MGLGGVRGECVCVCVSRWGGGGALISFTCAKPHPLCLYVRSAQGFSTPSVKHPSKNI